MLRKLFACCTIALLLSAPGALQAKEAQEKNGRSKEKHAAQSERQNESWPRETTRGHRPHDDNGDGVVTRNEWPGDDDSFKRLDRNGDGSLSRADRQVKPRTERRLHRQRR
jgi:hypothetical protein